MRADQTKPGNSNRLFDKIGSRANRFDQIRLGLALLVVLGHSWYLSAGPDAHVPLEGLTRMGFHQYSVFLFFFISGFLVTESARRRQGDMAGFVLARMLRIFPALIVCAVLTPVVLIGFGAWENASVSDALRYAFRLIGLIAIEFNVEGPFANLPFANSVNGSVWSLRHGVGVYTLLAIFAATGLFFTHRIMLALFAGTVIAIAVFGHALADKAVGGPLFLVFETRFVIVAFLIGVLAHRAACLIRLSWPVALGLLAAALASGQILPEAIAIYAIGTAFSYLVLCAAYLGRDPAGLKHDVSYGVYIYGWPVQQLAVMTHIAAYGVAPGPLMVFLLSAPLLVAIGTVSWLLIEKPALGLQKTLRRMPRGGRNPVGAAPGTK